MSKLPMICWINISAIVSCTLRNLLHAFATVRRQGINNTRLALTLGACYTAKSQLKAAKNTTRKNHLRKIKVNFFFFFENNKTAGLKRSSDRKLTSIGQTDCVLQVLIIAFVATSALLSKESLKSLLSG